ncbi:hypothetical protein SAMN04488057_1059 [Cyclobacterium lianum]|uniref:Uncharacterized protein n=2 Tax=Cyclobacterium lianum TaxID=388280 RepID=A0A1M7N1X1_9BACT|nr:hypothetical protein SAMN04488057_1059 [Cyclobacterium lianum]
MFSLVGIPLILFLLISFIFKSYSNIWVFPFNVEIWGTVSDWFMVWVTAITAIYLIKTFKKQQRLSEIEIVKFKEDIKPKFEANVEIFDFKENPDGTSTAKFKLILYVKNSSAYRVVFDFEKDFDLKEYVYDIIYENNSVSFPYFEVEINQEAKLIGDKYDPSESVFLSYYFYRNKLRIEFFDLEGAKYYQPIIIRINDDETIMSDNGPVSDSEKVFNI